MSAADRPNAARDMMSVRHALPPMNEPTLEAERPVTDQPPHAPRKKGAYFVLCGVLSAIAAVIAVYSQTNAEAPDEGFHMLAAQLIKAGRRPYLDFFLAQSPLNAYWNAAWMFVFGESWRVLHAAATVTTVAAIVLAVDFVFIRVPWPRWRLAVSLAATLLIGFSWDVIAFGPIAQAYGLCLFLLVASFRLAIAAVERNSLLLTALAGCAAGASAASTLLTAPIAPVVLLWILVYCRAGSRLARCAAFALGAAVPFLPVLWLFLQGPFQVRFGMINFHLFYRQVDWSGSLRHNLELIASWINSAHAMALGLLAIAGVLYIARGSRWERERRAEFYLAGWIALGQIAYLCYVRPTFEQYFTLTVPFLGILAAVGLYAVGSRLHAPDRPWLSFSILAFLLCFSMGKDMYDDRDSHTWPQYEPVAQKVDQVTPRNGMLLADEFVYFMTRRTPPSGLEYDDSHKLKLSAKDSAALHIFPRSELVRRVKAGVYDTVESCDDDDDPDLEALDLPDVYAQKAEIADCKIYWQRKNPRR
jgi:hypothetical protein